MTLLNARELARHARADSRGCILLLEDCLQRGRTNQPGGIHPREFSIQRLAEAFLGYEFIAACRDGASGEREGAALRALTEASSGSGAVMSGAFKNITQAVISSEVLNAYENAAFVWNQLARTQPTSFDGEKIVGVTPAGNDDEIVEEGAEYPLVGLGEDWIETPAGKKRGLRIAITEEAIWRDQTGQVLTNARNIGKALGVRKEKLVIDMALGVTNTYRWKGTSYDTYQAAAPWVNASSNVVGAGSTYTILNTALQKFAELKDPYTGDPITIVPTTIVCHSQFAPVFRAIMASLSMIIDTNANAGTQRTYNTVPLSAMMFGGQNPAYGVISSPWIDSRYTANSITNTFWYFGNFQEAFAVMEQWPFKTVEAPVNNPDEFSRDIVFQFKARERYALAVLQPREVQKNAT